MRSAALFSRPELLGGEPVVSVGGLPMPFVIAEAGVNHEGSMDTARRLIDEACAGGAHAIKFQSYKAATLASKDSPAYWDTNKEPTTSQFALFQRHDRFWKNEFESLKVHCDQAGIEFLSTPFDVEAAGFLNDLVDTFKISSSDITNMPFIKHICGFGKPIILSTGAAYGHEIMQAVEWIEGFGLPVALLHCILNYPTDDEHACLGMITAMREQFPGHIIGYSDHTLPRDMKTLETAALLGARILEKHFTHDKTLPGNDHYHAMDKVDLRLFMDSMRRIQALTGEKTLTSLPSEEPSRQHARRSLVTARDIKKGTLISRDDLTWKRPAHGISPLFFDQIIGLKAREDILEDTVLQWRLLE